jgi:hypothetical protein
MAISLPQRGILICTGAPYNENYLKPLIGFKENITTYHIESYKKFNSLTVCIYAVISSITTDSYFSNMEHNHIHMLEIVCERFN